MTRGEGFISVTRAFSRAISGLSADSSYTYGQVFLCKHLCSRLSGSDGFSDRHDLSTMDLPLLEVPNRGRDRPTACASMGSGPLSAPSRIATASGSDRCESLPDR
jgi:hypothetical protein